MECKAALKVRWTASEVTMLVEEWAQVCSTPGTKTLAGERRSKAIFDRYNGRCIRTGQLRRSPAAVNTQRQRMVHFARFVSDFDRSEQTQGRRPWFELSCEEQLEIDIPLEWRRQITTFTPESFAVFKDAVLPMEDQFGGFLKRKRRVPKIDKLRVKVRIKHRPCWSSQEEVLLAKLWGHFMQREGLLLAEFMEMEYSSRKCRRLACPGRSTFVSWKKIRALVASWEFISAFNTQHQPGWFELDDDEQDLQLMWGELPDNFEALGQEVFDAMEHAAPKYWGAVKVEPLLKNESDPVAPLSPQAISTPLQDGLMPPNLVQLALLCPADVGIGADAPATSDTALDRLLLEDDDLDNDVVGLQPAVVAALPSVNASALTPDTRLVPSIEANDSINDEGAATVQPVDLEPADVTPCNSAVHSLLSAVEKHTKDVQEGFHRLLTVMELEDERTQECIRAMKLDQRACTNRGLLKHMELVMSQQRNRLMTALRNAEEVCSQNGAEVRSLMQELLGAGPDSPHNDSSGPDVVARVAAPSDVALH